LSQVLISVEGDFTTTEESGMTIENKDQSRIMSFLRAFYKFCRPHTIRGTILASIAGTIRALLDTPGAFGKTHSPPFFYYMIVCRTIRLLMRFCSFPDIFNVQLLLNGVNYFHELS
jgi:hypothetical protein